MSRPADQPHVVDGWVLISIEMIEFRTRPGARPEFPDHFAIVIDHFDLFAAGT